jgi:hypothetical protein
VNLSTFATLYRPCSLGYNSTEMHPLSRGHFGGLHSIDGHSVDLINYHSMTQVGIRKGFVRVNGSNLNGVSFSEEFEMELYLACCCALLG